MIYPNELDGAALKESGTEMTHQGKDGLTGFAQPADLESAGLELTDEEQLAVAEAGAMPLEDTTVEKAYVTASCEGCVGNHVGTGVRVTIHK